MCKDYFSLLSARLEHPSNVLWKACELKALSAMELSYKAPILDIGSGDGILMDCFFDSKSIDIGLESDCKYTNNLKKSHAYKKIICGDIASERIFKESHFNTVLSFVTLHLISDLDKSLTNISRILSNNGHLIFTVPIDRFSNHLFFNFLGSWYAKYRNKRLSNIHLYSENEWIKILENHGFSVVCTKGYMGGDRLKIWDLLAFIKFIPFGGYIIKVLNVCGLGSILRFHYSSVDTSPHTSLIIVAKNSSNIL